jgi:ribosomal protein S25
MAIQEKRKSHIEILEEIIMKELVEKLAEQENIAEIPSEMIEKAYEGLLKHGRLSVYYLMRKLKCSESMARKIMTYLKQRT